MPRNLGGNHEASNCAGCRVQAADARSARSKSGALPSQLSERVLLYVTAALVTSAQSGHRRYARAAAARARTVKPAPPVVPRRPGCGDGRYKQRWSACCAQQTLLSDHGLGMEPCAQRATACVAHVHRSGHARSPAGGQAPTQDGACANNRRGYLTWAGASTSIITRPSPCAPCRAAFRASWCMARSRASLCLAPVRAPIRAPWCVTLY